MTNEAPGPFQITAPDIEQIDGYWPTDQEHCYLDSMEAQFDPERIGLALFGSTYRCPIPLLFTSYKDRGTNPHVTMTVELAHVIYKEDNSDPTYTGPEIFDRGDIYLRGVAEFVDLAGTPRKVLAHARLTTDPGWPASITEAELLLMCDERLVYASG